MSRHTLPLGSQSIALPEGGIDALEMSIAMAPALVTGAIKISEVYPANRNDS